MSATSVKKGKTVWVVISSKFDEDECGDCDARVVVFKNKKGAEAHLLKCYTDEVLNVLDFELTDSLPFANDEAMYTTLRDFAVKKYKKTLASNKDLIEYLYDKCILQRRRTFGTVYDIEEKPVIKNKRV